MSSKYVYYTQLPNVNELFSVFATIKSRDKVKNTLINHIILTCRQLIFENNNIIAFPQVDSGNMFGIYIVVKEYFFTTNTLHDYLEKHNLMIFRGPAAVSEYIYEECCLYTMTAKLAPRWNPINNFFIKGRNFLTDVTSRDCLDLKLSISANGNTSLKFEVAKMFLPFLSLSSLELSEKQMNILKQENFISLKDTNKIYEGIVLPSLKKVKILSIRLKLSESSFIKNYQQMRRHWKNTYGYRLPEKDENIFYVDIIFFPGSQIFTYPNICVRPNMPTLTKRTAKFALDKCVTDTFILVLQKNMPEILGSRYLLPYSREESNTPSKSSTQLLSELVAVINNNN